MPAGTGAYYAVMWAYNCGIAHGLGDTVFGTTESCTRGQFALMLYRFMGSPDVSGLACPYDDVYDAYDEYEAPVYVGAVTWAAAAGVVTDAGASFGPDEPITRRDAVMMLWRLAGCPAAETTSPYPDVAADDPCFTAAAWARVSGLTRLERFWPDGLCTRGDAAILLHRFSGLFAAD